MTDEICPLGGPPRGRGAPRGGGRGGRGGGAGAKGGAKVIVVCAFFLFAAVAELEAISEDKAK